MKTTLATLLLLALWTSESSALTLPDMGQKYLVGSTEELTKIRAAMRYEICQSFGPELQYCTYRNGQVESCQTVPNHYCGDGDGQVISAPWGLGAVDCMVAAELDPFVAQFYGASWPLPGGELVEIPAIEDLADQSTWPGECYGYQFALECTGFFGALNCPDPAL